MKGWIYIFSNRSIPGLIKIGYTDRDPSVRVSEQHSGLPFPHDLEYEILVENAYNVEQKIHKKLIEYNESKEWFKMDAEDAVSYIKEIVSDGILLENYYKADREVAERLEYDRKRKETERRRKEEEQLRKEKEHKSRIDEFQIRREQIIKTYDDEVRSIKLDWFGYFKEALRPPSPINYFKIMSKKNIRELLIAVWSDLVTIFFGVIFGLMFVFMAYQTFVDFDKTFILFWAGCLFWAFFIVKNSLEKRREESDEFQALICQRDLDIKNLKNEIFKK